jgi:hypothetical protein
MRWNAMECDNPIKKRGGDFSPPPMVLGHISDSFFSHGVILGEVCVHSGENIFQESRMAEVAVMLLTDEGEVINQPMKLPIGHA